MRLKTLGNAVLFCAFGLIATPFHAFATPYLSPKCQPKNIVPPVNGAGLLFDETCSTAYVMPPIAGKAELVNLATNTNLGFCEAQQAVSGIASSTIESAKQIADQIKNMIAGFNPSAEELVKLREKSAQLKAEKEAAEEKLASEKIREAAFIDAVEAARTALKTCTIAAADPATECAAQQRVVDDERAA